MQAPKKTVPVRDALRAKAAAEAQAQPGPDQHAIDEGRKALELRRKDGAALQAKALEQYAVPSAGLAAAGPIESGFHFSPAESDNELHFLQVEALPTTRRPSWNTAVAIATAATSFNRRSGNCKSSWTASSASISCVRGNARPARIRCPMNERPSMRGPKAASRPAARAPIRS